jgi:SnoaL-like domain
MIAVEDELQAIEDIKQLKARYFRCLDTKDWAGYADVFRHDCTFDMRTASTVDPDDGSQEAERSRRFVLTGSQVIADAVRDAVGDKNTVHHGHCHEIWVDSPNEARGIVAMVDKITNSRTGAHVLEGYGHYHENYRRNDGAWRISHLRLSRLHVFANLEPAEAAAPVKSGREA